MLLPTRPKIRLSVRRFAPGPTVLSLTCLLVSACHSSPGAPSHQLTAPITTQHPDRTWRFRLARDTGIPAIATYRLSEEFQVLQVRDAATWNELRASLHLEEVPTHLDFNSGIVVGVIASVGEPLAGDWPLSVEHVTVQNGVGSLAARVEEGLYNPVRSAPYGVMAYFRGLQRLAIVRINRRVFYFE